MTLLAEAPLLQQRSGGEPSLAALVEACWAELGLGLITSCPVCAGEMEPQYGQHASARGGPLRGVRLVAHHRLISSRARRAAILASAD